MEYRSSKSTNVSIGMGGSLIITIFVVLCLTVFSVLSFTTAHSDLKLAKKTNEITFDYYIIHGSAEEKLAEINDILVSLSKENTYSSSKDYINAALNAIIKIDGVSLDELRDNSFIVYYETLGNKNQKICATIEIMYDEANRFPYYDILTWNLEPIELPIYEEKNINLWEGFE